jgi:hypothetical protein
MTVPFAPTVFALCLLSGMLLVLELGRRMGIKRLASDPEGAMSGLGVIDAAVFGLFGLLVALTFSGAASRFDARRHLIVDETNSVGTAWLRLDLLPAGEQSDLRELFRRYVDSRLSTYRKLPDVPAAEAEIAESTRIQVQIWDKAVAACEMKRENATTTLVLGSLNSMIDIVTTRTAATRLHPPLVIFELLFVLGLCCALLAGFGMAGSKRRSWVHTIAFGAVIACSIYVIVELEYPRLGMIRVDDADRVLVELRESMN